MEKEFQLLETTLKNLCGKGPVYYFANPGNLGDALIRQGTLRFFQEKGIEYREITKNRLKWLAPCMKGGTLIYGGGGGWCRQWHHAESYLRQLHWCFEKVVVLPSTYETIRTLPGMTYFCRDFLQSKENVADALFCHDMAFYLGTLSRPAGTGSGSFMRTDSESLNAVEILPGNNDISTSGDQLSDIGPFIDEISQFSVVHTDRLHVAIVACLLGRTLHFYPGAYFKNEAVFLSSMKGYFNNIHFHVQDASSRIIRLYREPMDDVQGSTLSP